MSKEKIIKKIISLEVTKDNINIYLNGKNTIQYPIRLILLKWKGGKAIRGIIGSTSINYGKNISNLKCSFDISNGCNLKKLFLKISDNKLTIEDGTKNYVEILIYLRNEDSSILVNGDYNLMKQEYQLRKLIKKDEDMSEVLLSQKIREYFSELYVGLGGMANEQ